MFSPMTYDDLQQFSRRAYSVKALAAAWGCSTNAIYTLIKTGRLAAFSIGEGKRGLRISSEEVRRWEESAGRPLKSTDGGSPGPGADGSRMDARLARAAARP
jgi:hypothetical protein